MSRAIGLLGLVAIAFGQDLPTFRVNTRLVEVDVVVRDKAGPVKGLTKDDFSIFDNGKLQKVAAFSVFASGASSEKKTPLAPGMASNRLNSRGEEPAGATVLVWDALNTEVADQAFVRLQVLKYLRTLKPGDPVALYGLVKGLRIIQDFTDDPDRLLQAVARSKPEQSTDLSADDLTDLVRQGASPLVAALGGQATRDALVEMQKIAEQTTTELIKYSGRDRAYITLAAFRAIAQHLGGLPGRKKLIWFSAGFAADDTLQPLVDKTEAELNNANIAVYSIDARGLTTGLNMAGTALNRPSTAPDALPHQAGLLALNLGTLIGISADTGGLSYYASNDLVEAVGAAMQDDQVTYRLGFYPTDKKLDGSSHKLAVQVSRHAKDDVRYRNSYYALDATNAVSGQWREVLNETMQISLEATQVGLHASARPVEGEAGAYNLEVAVDLADLHLEKVKDRWVGVIDYALMFSPSDSMKGSLETVQINLTDERLKAAAQDGFVFRRKLTVGDKVGQVRVVIEDRATAAVGSVTVAIGKK